MNPMGGSERAMPGEVAGAAVTRLAVWGVSGTGPTVGAVKRPSASAGTPSVGVPGSFRRPQTKHQLKRAFKGSNPSRPCPADSPWARRQRGRRGLIRNSASKRNISFHCFIPLAADRDGPPWMDQIIVFQSSLLGVDDVVQCRRRNNQLFQSPTWIRGDIFSQ